MSLMFHDVFVLMASATVDSCSGNCTLLGDTDSTKKSCVIVTVLDRLPALTVMVAVRVVVP